MFFTKHYDLSYYNNPDVYEHIGNKIYKNIKFTTGFINIGDYSISIEAVHEANETFETFDKVIKILRKKYSVWPVMIYEDPIENFEPNYMLTLAGSFENIKIVSSMVGKRIILDKDEDDIVVE
ncbi:hypothetical protein ACMGE6_02110 [Macrococcus equi]|uniref:hypothetical protein n=1 Tax=Macrococcus equi TaxID=3395462 RepID=UPI0039BDEEB5